MKISLAPQTIKIVLILLLGSGIFFSQFYYDSWKKALAEEPDISYNESIEPHPLPSNVLKKASLGLDNLISDVVWLQTIQYYGGGLPYEKYRQLPALLNTTTDMDQKFGYPYTFGLLVLPGEGFKEEAVKFGTKGMENTNLKSQWEIPYYLGMVYHFNLKNMAKAATLFDEAAKRPGAPEITRLMAATYYAKSDQREIAYALYLVVYNTSNNKYIKERAKTYLAHWDLIFSLEKAGKIYKEKYGRYPARLDELVSGGIVKEIPADPLERELKINPATGIVSEVEK